MGDLTSRGWIVAKGIMFAIIVVMAGTGVVIHDDPWFRLGLLIICIWGNRSSNLCRNRNGGSDGMWPCPPPINLHNPAIPPFLPTPG